MSQWKVIPGVDLYFVTTTIVDWQYVFTAIPYYEIIIHGLKYCVGNKGLHLHAYVIMPNHAHYILSTDQGKDLSDIMRDFNTHTSREITSMLKAEGRSDLLRIFADAAKLDGRGNEFKVWQEGFHPVALQTEDFTKQKLNYLHNNPIRKGFVDYPEQWRYSSGRNCISDDHSIIKVECLF